MVRVITGTDTKAKHSGGGGALELLEHSILLDAACDDDGGRNAEPLAGEVDLLGRVCAPELVDLKNDTFDTVAKERCVECQRALTRLLSHRSHPTPRLQYWGQQHRRRGRLRARRHPQEDADHHPGVSHRPRLFAFVSAPVDTPSSRGSLGDNELCGMVQLDTYTTEGIAKLCEGLKGSSVTSLECAALPAQKCLLCVSAH